MPSLTNFEYSTVEYRLNDCIISDTVGADSISARMLADSISAREIVIIA